MIEFVQANNAHLVEFDRWHQDETLNRLTGAGGGEPGRKLVKQYLHYLATTPPPDTRLLVALDGDATVGYVVVSHINERHKRAQLHLTVSPDHRRQGLGKKILRQAIQTSFDAGLYRVEFNPLQGNHPAKELAHSLGFVHETLMVSSFWMFDGPVNQHLMRMTLREWDAEKGCGKVQSPRRRDERKLAS